MFATQERIDLSAAALQGSLFGFADPAVDATFRNLTRRQLYHGSWVDFAPNWLGGSDDVFVELLSTMSWTNRRVRMYDRILPEPRLSAWWTASSPSPFPLAIIQHAQTLLSARYDREFDSIGCNYYRDGRDSVAWHGDKLPGNSQQAVVAIISVGARRPFLLRPNGGGASIRFEIGGGDLLVMGGQSQVDWQHTVPKVPSSGPRISITLRHGAPRPDDDRNVIRGLR